jgi:shikimate kinase
MRLLEGPRSQQIALLFSAGKSMNSQHTNHYYNLEFTATNEQLELQRDMPVREIFRMQAEGALWMLCRELIDQESEL